MALFRSLYINDRFFYAMAICIGMFLLSYSFELLFYPGLVVLALITITLAADLTLLYRGENTASERIAPPVFSLHDTNKVRIILNNRTKRPLKIKVVDELPYQFAKRDLSFKVTLKPENKEVIEYSLVPTIRGAYEFGDLQLFVSTRIGFVSRRETTKAACTVAVYPSVMQMARQQKIAMQHPAFASGVNKSRRFGQSYEFDQVKAYVPGDDTRNINWKASSSMNEIMVNMYEDERSQQVYSIIDKSRVMKSPFDGLPLVDYAINATLAFSNIVLKKQDKAGLMIFSKEMGASVKAERGPRQLKKIMYALYKEQYDYSEASFETLYTTFRRTVPNRSLVFLYTNFETLHALNRNLNVLRLLNRHHLLVVVFFESRELEEYARSEADTLLDIYQLTMARRFLLEKNQISRELERHGIHSIRCRPENLSAATISKYLELKSRGRI